MALLDDPIAPGGPSMHHRFDTILTRLHQDLAARLEPDSIRAACRQVGVDVERISFVDALRWLGEARAGEELPKSVVNPDRPGRDEPRVRKRRPKQYPVMTRRRSVLRKGLLEAGVRD